MNKTFGQKFYELRKQKNLTQEQIAERLNISSQAVSKWENDLACPDIMLLKEIAEIFGVTVDELLGNDKPRTEYVPEAKDKSKMILKIRVVSNEGDKVNVNLPVALIELFLNSGGDLQAFGVKGNGLENIDFKQVLALINNGVFGKLVEIESADGDIVEIYVE